MSKAKIVQVIPLPVGQDYSKETMELPSNDGKRTDLWRVVCLALMDSGKLRTVYWDGGSHYRVIDPDRMRVIRDIENALELIRKTGGD